MQQEIINNIAEICYQHGIRKAIISPGSRNAPLTLAFARHAKIQCYSISDERSAAFVGLGMAQADKNTVVLICTSGSAALNYAPAVAEAFFQQVPLLILTADRPPEWIDQWDGQTIRQENIFGKHIKATFNFPVDNSHKDAKWQSYRIVNEAILASKQGTRGPVHINIPFREPFYPDKEFEWKYDENIPLISKKVGKKKLDKSDQHALREEFNQFGKVAFLLGQDDYSDNFLQKVKLLSHSLNIPVYADVISNGHSLTNAINLPDSLCMPLLKTADQQYVPDLLISFGKTIISKNLKLFLRGHVKKHWHVSEDLQFISDPYQILNQVIECDPLYFLEILDDANPKENSFLNLWKTNNEKIEKKTNDFLTGGSEFNEFSALALTLQAIKQHNHLHLANSLSVRYVNFIGVSKLPVLKVWVNRGTSGIDGSNSTAIGHAIANTKEQHILVTGDVAFFYDRNAFWHKYPYPNLKIILLNNQGGSIFRMIPGPREQAELQEFFETEQTLNATSLCHEFGINYFEVKNFNQLKNNLELFLKSEKAALLEIKSDSKVNQKIFEAFKTYIKQ